MKRGEEGGKQRMMSLLNQNKRLPVITPTMRDYKLMLMILFGVVTSRLRLVYEALTA